MRVEGTIGRYQEIDTQALAIAVFKDEKADQGFLKELDSATGGVIKSVIDSEELKGKEGETVFLHLPGNAGMKAQRLLLVGAGDRDDYRAAQVSQVAGTAARFLRGKNVKSLAIVPRCEGDQETIAAAAVEGTFIGVFELDKYRTVDKEERVIDRLVIVSEGADKNAIDRGVKRGQIVGESVNFTRDLANEPGANMTPSDMAERAREIAKEFGLSVDVLDQARMEKEGMGSLLSVSRGSEQPPQLIILKYTPAKMDKNKTELLAFVGKGITFDSGGISLKPGENMELMKYDMTGGATVMGAMRAIAQLKPAMPILESFPVRRICPQARPPSPATLCGQ